MCTYVYIYTHVYITYICKCIVFTSGYYMLHVYIYINTIYNIYIYAQSPICKCKFNAAKARGE